MASLWRAARTRGLACVVACLLGEACVPVFHAAEVHRSLIDQEAARLASRPNDAVLRRVSDGIELGSENIRSAFVRVSSTARPLCEKEGSNCTFSLRLLDDYEPIAFMDKHGTVHLTIGLIAVLETEDELAFVLGHEIGHHVGEHIEENETKATVGAVALGMLAVLGAAAGVYTDPYTGAFDSARANRDMSNLTSAGAQIGRGAFSQSQEIEADYLAMLMVREAGYDPSAGIGAFEVLSSYMNGEQIETSFFGSHPGYAERIARLRAAIRENRTLIGEVNR